MIELLQYYLTIIAVEASMVLNGTSAVSGIIFYVWFAPAKMIEMLKYHLTTVAVEPAQVPNGLGGTFGDINPCMVCN